MVCMIVVEITQSKRTTESGHLAKMVAFHLSLPLDESRTLVQISSYSVALVHFHNAKITVN